MRERARRPDKLSLFHTCLLLINKGETINMNPSRRISECIVVQCFAVEGIFFRFFKERHVGRVKGEIPLFYVKERTFTLKCRHTDCYRE